MNPTENQITISADEAIERIRNNKQEWNNWVKQNKDTFVDFREYEFKDLERNLFEEVYFPKVSFKENVFKNEISFISCHFLGEADFFETIFFKIAYFRDTTFTKNAYFRSATFTEEANFIDVTFTENTNFENTTFTKTAYFENTTFTKTADFENTTFTKTADFENTTFTKTAYFINTKFTETAYFTNTKFTQTANFENTTFTKTANFINTKFTKTANFENTTFTKTANFINTKFTKTANFENTTFTETAYFINAKFFGFANFINAKFFGFANFSQSCFKLYANFQGVEFDSVVNFEDSEFYRVPDLRKTKMNFHFTCNRMKIFPYCLKNWGIFDKAENQDEADKLERLKDLAKQSQDHEQEQEFFALELKAKRFYQTNGFNLIFSYVYQFFSDFGRSVYRPLFLLFLTWWLFAGLYRAEDKLAEISDAVKFSTHTLFPFLGVSRLLKESEKELFKDLSTYVISLGYLQSFLALTFIFLIGLALRNKFKI